MTLKYCLLVLNMDFLLFVFNMDFLFTGSLVTSFFDNIYHHCQCVAKATL